MKRFWDKIGHWVNLAAICGGIVAVMWLIRIVGENTEAVKEFQKFQKGQIELNGKYEVIMEIVLKDVE